MKNLLQQTPTNQNSETHHGALEMIKNLLHEHEVAINALHKTIAWCDKKYNDSGTVEFLKKMLQDHETISCTLRSVG